MSTNSHQSEPIAQTAPVDQNTCPHCGTKLVFVENEASLEPTSTLYACEDHREYGNGDCPGTVLRVYEDGVISRRVFGQGVIRESDS